MKKKKLRNKHFSKGAKVNVIQFITVKEKWHIINAMFYLNDLGSVVYREFFFYKSMKKYHV